MSLELPEDLPTPADYDGDGKADVSSISGHQRRLGTGKTVQRRVVLWLSSSDCPEDKPTVGDFDG